MTKISLFISRFIASVMMLVTLGGALTASVLVASPTTVYAQQACGNSLGDRLPNFGTNCVGGLSNVKGDKAGIAALIQSIANFFIFVLAAISVLFIVYGGFLYVTDDGSGTKAGQGKKIVLNALLGLIIAVVSFTLVSLVVNLVSTVNVGSATNGGSPTTGGPGMINIL